ncbi:MAG TPA: VOC family protein [Candidatus Binataceae bacterium]|nr:VOC family protein [Candidatus Binataceae bacterium]
MNVQPYLFFDGRCEEALAFYTKALGAEVTTMMRFKDNPDPQGAPPNVQPDKVMHARVRIGDTVIFAGDGMCRGTNHFDGFSLSLTVATEAEADHTFNALLAGGKTVMPLGKTFFSPRFGMVTDRYGIGWMVYVAPAEEVKLGTQAKQVA